uniref:Uncharacterized protein n=1 Tax=Kalanchoe fedtschenkoi TaxID=63787 RepID=A0A7N0UA08_KALFE
MRVQMSSCGYWFTLVTSEIDEFYTTHHAFSGTTLLFKSLPTLVTAVVINQDPFLPSPASSIDRNSS